MNQILAHEAEETATSYILRQLIHDADILHRYDEQCCVKAEELSIRRWQEGLSPKYCRDSEQLDRWMAAVYRWRRKLEATANLLDINLDQLTLPNCQRRQKPQE